jgi:hypothetical protein
VIVNLNDRIVAFDCDDTLVMWVGNDFEPHPKKLLFKNPTTSLGTGEVLKTEDTYLVPHQKHIQKLKGYSKSGYFVIVWSAGGGAWAKEVIKVLGLEEHVHLVTGKPVYLFDDLPLQDAIGERKYFQPKKFENE